MKIDKGRSKEYKQEDFNLISTTRVSKMIIIL